MTETQCFIGIDPGPTTGLAVAYWHDGWVQPAAFQCDAAAAVTLLRWVLRDNGHCNGRAPARKQVRAQVEEFRLGTGAGARGPDAAATRSLSEDLAMTLMREHVPCLIRPAAAVKPWATDKRLEKAGLIRVTSGMPQHARDAFRHLLFTAVHDGGVPDPLSKSAGGASVNYRVRREL